MASPPNDSSKALRPPRPAEGAFHSEPGIDDAPEVGRGGAVRSSEPSGDRPRGWRAWIGPLIGVHGWLIGLGLVLFESGDLGAALDVLPTALFATTGAGFATVLCVEAAERARPGDARLRLLVLSGMLLFTMGVLLTFAKWLVMPRVLVDDSARETLEALGGATDVPTWIVGGLFLCAVPVLFAAVNRLFATD